MKTPVLLYAILFYSVMNIVPAHAQTQNFSGHNLYGFAENKGQIVDQFGNARSDVKFIFRSSDFKLILHNNGFSYQWSKAVPVDPNASESGQFDPGADEDDLPDIPLKIITNRVDVNLSHCNSDAIIYGTNPLSFYTNYFNNYTGPSGITRVQSFNQVIYQNIYDGVDLVFSFTKNGNGLVQPEYKFIVHPYGNIRDIHLLYHGEEQLALNTDGSLKSKVDLGFVKETTPVIQSEEGKFLQQGKFILNGSNVSFSNVKHSKEQTIVIDPTIEWGSYYGGNGKDVTDELAYDGKQHIYLTGRTHSTDMIATTGAYQTTYSGGDDVPLLKIDEQGNVLWGTYYGGKGNDVSWAITTDTMGNVFLGGRTVSPSGIATAGAVIDTFSGGFFDVFIAKFSADGDLLYGTYMGGNLKDEVQGLGTNAHGDLYVSGYSESLYGISTPGAYKSVGDTNGEIFLMKWTNDMHLLWSTYYGGKSKDRGHGVCEDKYGNVYQVGTVGSKENIATPGAFQTTIGGKLDGFLAKWTPDGHPKWVTYYGGSGDERLRDVRTDDDGNIYFVGQTESGNNISTPGVFKPVLEDQAKDNRDALIAKFDSSGHRMWGTYFGGNFIEMPRSLVIPPSGAPIYISGLTKSDSGFATPGAYNVKLGGHNDAFFAVINHNATQLMYSTYYGGKGSESVNAGGWYGPSMEMDENENIFLSSLTKSADSIATPGSYRDTILTTDEFDFFIAKFNNSCSDPWENNDDFDHASRIPLDPITHSAKLHAQIEIPSDPDYFKVVLDKNYITLTVSLTELPFNGGLFVYDENKNQVGASQHQQRADEQVVLRNVPSGTYYILVKDDSTAGSNNSNCYQLRIAASDDVATNILQNNEAESFSLFPNPAHGSTILQWQSKQAGTHQIQISDLPGRVLQVKEVEMNVGENDIELSLSTLAPGNYQVKVSGDGKQWVRKLVVQ